MKLSISVTECNLLVAVLCLAPFGRLAAQKEGSLKNLDLEAAHSESNRDASLLGDISLNKKLSDSQDALQSLQGNFGTVSNEAEFFRRKSSELNSRLEALGASSIDSRLLKLINELRMRSSEREKLRDALISIIDATGKYQKRTVIENSFIKSELDLALRESSEALGIGSEPTLGILQVPALSTESIVVSVKEELALVVANVGFRRGVRLGMSFGVVQNGAEIGTIRVIDVRDNISGALVQNLGRNGTIKVGDRLKVVSR